MRKFVIVSVALLLAAPALAGSEAEDVATQLMATMAFARNTCPQLVVHSEQVQATVEAMGIDPWELTSKRQNVIHGQNIYDELRPLGARLPQFCLSLNVAFGENGTERRGLVSNQ